jgi:hypothetical protein
MLSPRPGTASAKKERAPATTRDPPASSPLKPPPIDRGGSARSPTSSSFVMTVVEPFDVEDPKAASKDGESKDKADKSPEYKKEGVIQTVRARGGWLTVFFVGLVLAALVVEEFEDVLTANVELSYFVPLLIGHGGNTGSQSVATVIRAMALKQISTRDAWVVVYKESAAGFVMGAFLGVLVRSMLCFAFPSFRPRDRVLSTSDQLTDERTHASDQKPNRCTCSRCAGTG